MSNVIVSKIDEYDTNIIKLHITKSIEKLGGFSEFFKQNQTILLKTNLVLGKDPKYAATTHNIFLEALAHYFIDNKCNVIIADSPGGLFNEKRLKKVYRLSKIDTLECTNIKLNYNTKSSLVKIPNSISVKDMPICDFTKNVDHIISVAKLKTHTFMGFTGAVKNLFGVVPGLSKAKYHVSHKNVNDFADMIIDLCEYIKPTLSFIDGIIAMEGNGPTGGSPISMKTMLVSDNPHHLDSVACDIIGINKSEVATTYQAIKRNLLKRDYSDVEIIGENPNSLKKNIKKAKTNNASMFLNIKFLRRFKRFPQINKKKCIGCKECADVCPKNIINMKNNKAEISYKKCINCFCCHEFCAYHAIDVKRRILKSIK